MLAPATAPIRALAEALAGAGHNVELASLATVESETRARPLGQASLFFP